MVRYVFRYSRVKILLLLNIYLLVDLIYYIVSNKCLTHMKIHQIQLRIKTQESPGLISIMVLRTRQDKTLIRVCNQKKN